MPVKVGPVPTENVWFANSWSKVAHRWRDKRPWGRTACGRRTYEAAKVGGMPGETLGLYIRWDSLDQQKINLCKVCWKDYEPVYSSTMYELIWWGEQHKRVGDIFREAWTVISTPTHLDQFNVDGPGGNVVHSSTMLNYETLKGMLRIMLQEETHRKISRQRMAELMTELGRWENEHPYGEPIVEEPDERPIIVGILPA